MCIFSTICVGFGTVLLHHLSSPHSLRGLGHKLESNSGTEPPPPPLTSDVTPVKCKVAPWLTASQGIDYSNTASTANPSHHQERDRHRMVRHTSIDTLYVVITGPATHVCMEGFQSLQLLWLQSIWNTMLAPPGSLIDLPYLLHMQHKLAAIKLQF